MSDDDFELDYNHDIPTDIRGKTQVPWEKFDAPREEKGNKTPNGNSRRVLGSRMK